MAALAAQASHISTTDNPWISTTTLSDSRGSSMAMAISPTTSSDSHDSSIALAPATGKKCDDTAAWSRNAATQHCNVKLHTQVRTEGNRYGMQRNKPPERVGTATLTTLQRLLSSLMLLLLHSAPVRTGIACAPMSLPRQSKLAWLVAETPTRKHGHMGGGGLA